MRSGFLAVGLKRGQFVQIDTGSGLVKVLVYRTGKSGAELAIQAPKSMTIARDKVLAGKGGDA